MLYNKRRLEWIGMEDNEIEEDNGCECADCCLKEPKADCFAMQDDYVW
jgi:hypothetical protein